MAFTTDTVTLVLYKDKTHFQTKYLPRPTKWQYEIDDNNAAEISITCSCITNVHSIVSNVFTTIKSLTRLMETMEMHNLTQSTDMKELITQMCKFQITHKTETT